MTGGAHRRPARWLVLAGVVCSALLLSGCVYLRLLQLKRQLADFERNFAVGGEPGLRLEFRTPVLLADDLRFLGFYPATTRRVGTAEHWRLRWIKEPAANVRERLRYEISFELFFSQEKMTALDLGEKYFAVMPREVVVAGLKSLGSGRIDKSSRTLESNVLASLKDKVIPPSVKNVEEMLGAPTETSVEGNRETLRYRFISDDPGQKGKGFDLRLVYDATTGDLREVHGRMPVGTLHLKFDPPASSAAKSSP